MKSFRITPEDSTGQQDKMNQIFKQSVLGLTKQGVDELIRLLESDKFNQLTSEQISEIGEYRPIEIEGEEFFKKAFSQSKETSTILKLVQNGSISKEEALEKLKEAQEIVKEYTQPQE